MGYRCVATSIQGFVQQLAVAYITHGYWFYVVGEIPEGKDSAVVDAKLIERYGIAISKWARCRRKKQGLANMQYLRYERIFVLLATKGRHEFFEREWASLRDVRRTPIRFAAYSIGCRKGRDGRWHASVRINNERYGGLRAHVVDSPTLRSTQDLLEEIRGAGFEAYAPVQRQLSGLLRTASRKRGISGAVVRANSAPCVRRRIVQPFLVEQ